MSDRENANKKRCVSSISQVKEEEAKVPKVQTAEDRYVRLTINSLGGSDMCATLFVQDSAENAEKICQLIHAIRILDGGKNTNTSKTYKRRDIESFFANPLAQSLLEQLSGTSDSVATMLLIGKLTMPGGLFDENDNTGWSLPADADVLKDRWEASPLQCTKYPKWQTICEECVTLCDL